VKAIDSETLSDLALSGTRGAADFSSAASAKSEIVAAFIAALEGKMGRFHCFGCKANFFRLIGQIEEPIRCKSCGGKVIALTGELSRGKIVRERAERDWETSSSLILARGKDAALALSVYGIGTKTAAQILRKPHKSREALFADLLEAQKLFIRNKKYW
jgi:ATP-dependent Lhr-like helicase